MKNKKKKLIYEEGAYLWGNHLNVILQNWVILTIDKDVLDEYGDEMSYLVCLPYGYYSV